MSKSGVPRPRGSGGGVAARSSTSAPLLSTAAGKVAPRHTFQGQGITVSGTGTASAFPAVRWGRFTWI